MTGPWPLRAPTQVTEDLRALGPAPDPAVLSDPAAPLSRLGPALAAALLDALGPADGGEVDAAAIWALHRDALGAAPAPQRAALCAGLRIHALLRGVSEDAAPIPRAACLTAPDEALIPPLLDLARRLTGARLDGVVASACSGPLEFRAAPERAGLARLLSDPDPKPGGVWAAGDGWDSVHDLFHGPASHPAWASCAALILLQALLDQRAAADRNALSFIRVKTFLVERRGALDTAPEPARASLPAGLRGVIERALDAEYEDELIDPAGALPYEGPVFGAGAARRRAR